MARIRELARSLTDALHEGAFDRALPEADQLVAVSERYLRQIAHDPGVHPELSAALQVFRNAAFVFRKLARERRDDLEMAATCLGLLDQAEDHFGRYIRSRAD